MNQAAPELLPLNAIEFAVKGCDCLSAQQFLHDWQHGIYEPAYIDWVSENGITRAAQAQGLNPPHRCVRCGRTSQVVKLGDGCPFCDAQPPNPNMAELEGWIFELEHLIKDARRASKRLDTGEVERCKEEIKKAARAR